MTRISMNSWLNTSFIVAGGLTVWIGALAGMIYT